MAAKDNMKEEIETMRRHFGSLVALVKDLKGRVETLEKEKDQSDALENKTSQGINEKVDNILKKQDAVDKAIAANKEAITEIDHEIKEIFKQRKYSDDEKRKKPIENAIDDTDHELSDHKKQRKSWYFNRGFCKYTTRCRFKHPDGICGNYLQTKDRENVECIERHPKQCKWEQSGRGCRRGIDCAYLHTSLQNNRESFEILEFQCSSCKSAWKDTKFVKEHRIRNMKVFFCLNCDDWVQDKGAVFDQGWTLFDEAGFLRRDVKIKWGINYKMDHKSGNQNLQHKLQH